MDPIDMMQYSQSVIMSKTRILALNIPRLPPIQKRTRQLDRAAVPILRSLLDDSSKPHPTLPVGPAYPGSLRYPENTWYLACEKHRRENPVCNAHPHAIGIHRVGPMVSIFTCCEDWFEIPRDVISDPLLLAVEDPETFLRALLEWVDEHESGLHRSGAV